MICAYSADAVDFTTNGLGPLDPIECTVTETLNGMWELTLTHTLDEFGKWNRIQLGNIIKAPVPSGKTPALSMSVSTTQTEVYKVSTSGMRLNMRSGAGTNCKVIAAYKPGTEVVIADRTTNTTWFEVIAPDGKHGWMYAANLVYVRTDSTGGGESAVIEARKTRDQPFRIYKIVPGLDKITAYARHVFYDLADNLMETYQPENRPGAEVATQILAKCRTAHGFTIYSDLTESASADWQDKTPVDALLGDAGLLDAWSGELARDWWDIYAVTRVGRDTDISIRQGKNLKGLSGSLDDSGVITRIMPVGSDKDGNALYLPELYVDSENINDYPTIRWGVLNVSDAKECSSGDNAMTKEECYAQMRESAQAEFDAGCDMADYTLDVDFVVLSDTVEYAAYAGLNDLAIGDSVRIIAPGAGINTALRLTDYVFDCLKKEYTSMLLGTLAETIASSGVTLRQFPNGSLTGNKIARGAVGTPQMADGCVNGLKVAMAAIGIAHMNQAAVDQLAANAIVAVKAEIQRLVAGEIVADQLYADLAAIAVAQITTANISNANIDWATIANLTAAIANIANAQIGSASIGTAQIKDAKIDWAKIYDLTADTAIISEGVGGKLYIARLAVTEANMTSLTVGELMVKAEDGSFKRLTVDADGNVTAETVQVEGGNVADNTISGGKLIENTITARELNVESIFADTALIRAIKAANIDVSDLFAAEATISALNSWLIKADTIQSLQGQLNLWASDKITAAVSAVQVGGTNMVTLGNQSLVNAGGRAAEYIGKDWYRESEHQTTISPYSGVCWLQCPGIDIVAGRKYTLSYYAWIQPGATAGEVKFRPNLFGGTSDTDKYLTDFILFVIGTPTKYAVTFDTTGWTTGTYTLRFVMMTGQTHEVYFTDVKLEEGTKATAWSPNPNEVRIGSSILMDVNHTEISTPYLDIDVSGTEGDMHIDENGISAGTATFETLNCPDIVKYYTGESSITLAEGSEVSVISNALSNHMLTYDVTITLTGDVNGALILKGMCGSGNVTVKGAGHTLNGYALLSNNGCRINVESLKISKAAANRQCVNADRCVEAKFYNCIFNANNAPSNAQGISTSYSSVFLKDCEFYNIPDSAMSFSYGTDALVLACKGAAKYCFWYDGATFRVAGSRPSGLCAGGNPSFLMPADPSTITVNNGSATPIETPVTTTSYTASVTGTYYPSGHWINDNTIRQGHEGTGSNARKDYGCMWFNAGALAGKTIKSATLTIKRISGKGRSSSVALKLWTTTLTGKSGKPTDSLVNLGEIGKIANGETATFNIPTSAISVIASGGGLVLYTEETSNASGKTYSPNYAHFEGVGGAAPVLTVTYQ